MSRIANLVTNLLFYVYAICSGGGGGGGQGITQGQPSFIIFIADYIVNPGMQILLIRIDGIADCTMNVI